MSRLVGGSSIVDGGPTRPRLTEVVMPFRLVYPEGCRPAARAAAACPGSALAFVSSTQSDWTPTGPVPQAAAAASRGCPAPATAPGSQTASRVRCRRAGRELAHPQDERDDSSHNRRVLRLLVRRGLRRSAAAQALLRRLLQQTSRERRSSAPTRVRACSSGPADAATRRSISGEATARLRGRG